MSPPERESRPGGDTETALKSMGADYCEHNPIPRQLRARRAASRRLPVLDSGRADPWHHPPPTTGYADAAHHLLGCGLTPAPNRAELQAMWRRGGHHRKAAALIAQRWELVA